MISNKNNKFSHALLNRQKGFSLLELLVVIGILAVTSGFIYPEIGSWKIKRNIEKDFQAIVSTMDYLKTRTRTVNGTSVLYCNVTATDELVMTYQISTQRNDSVGAGVEWTIHPNFASNIIEDPSNLDPSFNLITGLVNVSCPNAETLFNASGNAGNVSDGSALDIEVNFAVGGIVDYVNFNAYKVRLNSATAFLQKFKYNLSTEAWVELN